MSTNPTTQPPVPVAILVRVSTDKQKNDRQVQQLKEVAISRNWEVIEVIEEQISGAKQKDLRVGLDRALHLAATRQIKKVMVHEVSRIARKNSIAHDFIEQLEEMKVSLYWHAQGFETILPNGKRSPAAGVMFALMSEQAVAERDTLRERIMSGLEEARRKGKVFGRPKGKVKPTAKRLEDHKDILKQLRDGQSIRNAAKITGKSTATVLMVKKLLAQA